MSDEEWLEAPAPYSRYLVSTHGRCYRVDTRHMLKPIGMMQHKPRRPDGALGYKLQPDGGARGGSYVPITVLMWRTFRGTVGRGAKVELRDRVLGFRLENLVKVATGCARDSQRLSEKRP